MATNHTESLRVEETSLRDIAFTAWAWILFLKTRVIFISIAILLGLVIGFFHASTKRIEYIASLTFVLEDEKNSNGGLAGAIGLVNSLGIDVGGGSGSGVFSGSNLIELMKSRRIVEKTLLQPINIQSNRQSLADYYIKMTGLDVDFSNDSLLKGVNFDPLVDRNYFTKTQDSILGVLYKKIIDKKGLLSVAQKDKKLNIITVESRSADEFFSKKFTETLTAVVSEFYIETKTKKAKQNFDILQKQTDSVRIELNNAIRGVAIANDNVYGLNPALNIRRTPSMQRQVDVQVNTTVLTQLIPNLEMAKVSLRKETPLIQIIDTPILPLNKNKPNKLKTMILYGLISGFAVALFLIINQLMKNLKQDFKKNKSLTNK